jgi:hypothetical protein
MASILQFDTWQNTAGTTYNAILQVVTGTYNSNGSTTSTANPPVYTAGLELFSTSFTPKKSTSRILVQSSTVSMHEESNTGNIHWLGAWYGAGNLIGVNSGMIHYGSWTGALQGAHHSLNHSVPSWGTTAQTITIRAGSDSSTLYVNYNTYANATNAYRVLSFTIMEIDQ